MKTLFLHALVPGILLGIGLPCGAGVLPDHELYVNVETNDWMERPRGKEGLNVSVNFFFSNHAGKERKPSVKVLCFEFPADCRQLGERELMLFHRVCEEAEKGQEKMEKLMSRGFRGEVETVFESKIENGEWVTSLSRGGKAAIFDPSESRRVKAAIAEARAGAAWFKLLRTADKLPEETPEAHPPMSGGYSLSSKIGEVDGGGIHYEVSLDAMTFGEKVIYRVDSSLTFENGTTSGGWVDKALVKISEAAEAARTGRKFVYESGKDAGLESDVYYSVTANLQTGKADVALAPGDFFEGKAIRKASFGVDEVRRIRQLKEDLKIRQKWFEEHEALFFSRPPAKRK